jgi:hypothetical protein
LKGCKLTQTSVICPEAYDVEFNGKYIGHLHLRHGTFTAQFGNHCLYTGFPKGDGIFETDERKKFLKKGVKALKKHAL